MKKTPKRREAEHEFTLVLTGIDRLDRRTVDALFESGCDDATIAMRCGRPFITFSRKASSLKDAILSAIRNVRDAGIGADVLRVDDSQLVTQAEIARRIGRTRQLVHQYFTGKRGPGGFPAPVCEIADGARLWYWREVAHWLWQNDMIAEDALRTAEEVEAINTALELIRQKQANRKLAEEVMRTVASA